MTKISPASSCFDDCFFVFPDEAVNCQCMACRGLLLILCKLSPAQSWCQCAKDAQLNYMPAESVKLGHPQLLSLPGQRQGCWYSVTERSLVLQGGYSYSGQRCTAVKVVLVAEEVADELVAKVKKGVEGLSVGMPEVCALFLNPLHCQ